MVRYNVIKFVIFIFVVLMVFLVIDNVEGCYYVRDGKNWCKVYVIFYGGVDVLGIMGNFF